MSTRPNECSDCGRDHPGAAPCGEAGEPKRSKRGKPRQTPGWTDRDNVRACETMGWAIFSMGDMEGATWETETDPCLQADDDTGAFPNDDAAWMFVKAMAYNGNKLCRKAIRFLARRARVFSGRDDLRAECRAEIATWEDDDGK